MPLRNEARERDCERVMDAVLREHYFNASPRDYVDSPWGRNDLESHVRRRLRTDRTIIVPWLNRIRRLAGAEVLEIGCGTGSSTVALAEQGARVTAVDIDERSIAVARERCRLYGVDAVFVAANAAALPVSVSAKQFDMILFYASLEHMTLDERLDAIGRTWAMLPRGGLWSVIEMPNRLWYFDWHTSMLPFFQWLPDELAFRYSRFSRRPRFNDLYQELSSDALLHFLRRGRGVSFHELEVVLGRLESLELAGWLDWDRETEPWWERLRKIGSPEWRYRRLLRRLSNGVNQAFLLPRIDVVLRKTGRELETSACLRNQTQTESIC